MNQFNASNVKNYFPNWPKIGNNEKTLEKIKCVKIPLRRIPDKRYNQNSSFTIVETKAADKKICKLLKEEAINCSFHEQGAMHLRNFYDHQKTTRVIG